MGVLEGVGTGFSANMLTHGGPSRNLASRASRSVVGPDHVLTDPSDAEPFLVDWRGRHRGAALAVVRPGSTAEVAAVVVACREAGIPIVPQGGNTGLVAGAHAERRRERGAGVAPRA